MGTSSSFEKVGECLYRNPSSGTYYALVKVRGKQIKSSLETKNLPEARRKLKDFKADLERIDTSLGKINLSQLAEKYEKTIQHFSASTITNKTRVLNLVQTEWPGGADRQLAKIKPSEVGLFLSRYSGIAGYNQALETLRAMFSVAVLDGMIPRSPTDGIKQRKRETPIRPTPTVEQFNLIVDHIRNQPYSDTAEESADFLEFLGLAGLGQAEGSAFTFQSLQLDRNQLITFRQKTRSGFAIPIYPQLRPLLEKRLALATEANAGSPPPPNQKVFKVSDIKKALSAACTRLALPQFSPRAFRRMFITTALERGIDVQTVSKWQGHKDGGKLLLDTYSHVRPIHSERMALLMS